MRKWNHGIEKFISRRMKERILRDGVPEWMRKHPRGKYIIASVLAAPLWLDKNTLKDLRRRAIRESEATGKEHVLAHIIPLTHPFVCGLTVPWNLRVALHVVNVRERNEFHPDQLRLDVDTEQTQQRRLACL